MTDQPKESAIERFTQYFVENYPGPTTIITDPKWHATRIFRAARIAMEAELAAKDAELDRLGRAMTSQVASDCEVMELRTKLANLEGIDKACDAANKAVVLLQDDVDAQKAIIAGYDAKLAPSPCPNGCLMVDWVAHKPDCVAMLDDESDHENLTDAGTCTCGVNDVMAVMHPYCRRCRELEEARLKVLKKLWDAPIDPEQEYSESLLARMIAELEQAVKGASR